MEYFSSNLIFLRKKNKKTQAEQADFLKLKRTTYASYELSASKPDFDTLLNISKLLGISPGRLIDVDLSKEKHENKLSVLAEPSETYGNKSNNVIPLYSDVSTIGGINDLVSHTGNQIQEYIDAGDWFPGATAAIRHYGDSMNEYPSGCILALKDIVDLEHGFVLGQNYVVEYGNDYNRVTKRVQKKGKLFMAYSTNESTYTDGSLIHQPFELINIHRAWRVLGYVVKHESLTGIIRTAKN